MGPGRVNIEALRREMDGLRREVSRDLISLGGSLSDRFETKLESKLDSQTKTLVVLMSAQVVAVAGLAFAAARLA